MDEIGVTSACFYRFVMSFSFSDRKSVFTESRTLNEESQKKSTPQGTMNDTCNHKATFFPTSGMFKIFLYLDRLVSNSWHTLDEVFLIKEEASEISSKNFSY